MLIVGLTGSIAMGKSTAAALLMQQGYAVHEADKCVHHLLAEGGKAATKIADVFPEVMHGKAVNRQRLGQLVYQDEAKLKQLEAIVHPLVGVETKAWLQRQSEAGQKLVILDIPLLYEVGRDVFCDAVLLVSAPPEIQQARYLARDGATLQRFQEIIGRQWPDSQKRAKADFLIETDKGIDHTDKSLQAALHTIQKTTAARAWSAAWRDVA